MDTVSPRHNGSHLVPIDTVQSPSHSENQVTFTIRADLWTRQVCLAGLESGDLDLIASCLDDDNTEETIAYEPSRAEISVAVLAYLGAHRFSFH